MATEGSFLRSVNRGLPDDCVSETDFLCWSGNREVGRRGREVDASLPYPCLETLLDFLLRFWVPVESLKAGWLAFLPEVSEARGGEGSDTFSTGRGSVIIFILWSAEKSSSLFLLSLISKSLQDRTSPLDKCQ